MNEYNEHRKFKELFGINKTFRDHLMSGLCGCYIIDVIALDTWMEEHRGYDIDEHGSLRDFIAMEFSEEAAQFVQSHLGAKTDGP